MSGIYTKGLVALLALIAFGVAASVNALADTEYTLTISNGVYTFSPVEEVTDPDDGSDDEPDDSKPPVTYEDPELAEIAYCQNFDTSQGLTFEYVAWQQRCDTNKDGAYKFCEDWVYRGPITFQAIWWNRGCQDDVDFTPVKE